jgi:hypothetical protein
LAQRVKPFMLQDGVCDLDKTTSFIVSCNLKRCQLHELHNEIKGHFSLDINVRKIADASYWQPTMNKDGHEFC